jgi:hypothetical protein
MTNSLNINEELAFSASFGNPEPAALADGFNQYGVRENYDEDENLRSIDVNYEAMEPGEPESRNGVRITTDFLRKVGSKEYSGDEPALMDHKRETLSKIGSIRDVWFSDEAGKLMVQARIPNTGARTHDEIIKRFTYDPPTVTNGSVGFGDSYTAIRNDDGEPELVDATLQEFSTTPFPGGYDEGGLRAAFAEAALDANSNFAEYGDVDPEYRDEVYDEWDSLVNMTNEQMEMWDEHPCAKAVEGGENVRDEALMLLGQPREEWGMQNVEVANQVVDYLYSKMEEMPDNPNEGEMGSCPSRWAIEVLNRGHNPFDSFPQGNPNFNELSVTVDTFEVDDETDDTRSSRVDSENSEVAVFTETVSI